MDDVWMVYGLCMGGVWVVYGWCMDGVWDGYLGHEDLFCIVLLCILVIFFIYLLLLLGPYCFCPLVCPSLREMFPWYL